MHLAELLSKTEGELKRSRSIHHEIRTEIWDQLEEDIQLRSALPALDEAAAPIIVYITINKRHRARVRNRTAFPCLG